MSRGEAIKKFWAGLIRNANATGAKLASVDVLPAGEEVVEIGRTTLTTAQGTLEVKYAVFWRQENGRWKWHVDIWNQNS